MIFYGTVVEMAWHVVQANATPTICNAKSLGDTDFRWGVGASREQTIMLAETVLCAVLGLAEAERWKEQYAIEVIATLGRSWFISQSDVEMWVSKQPVIVQ